MAEGGGDTLARRDPEAVRAALEPWLGRALQADGPARVASIALPSGAGFSNETFLVDVEYAIEGRACARAFAVQAEPIGSALFERYDLAKVFELQRALARHDVPVAPMRWYEPDPEALGAPFYVMDRVAGRVPSDNPSYHAEGFVADAKPGERESMWWSAIDAMAAIHRVELDALPSTLSHALGPLDDPVGERLAWWERFVAWASPDPLPHFAEAMQWLHAHRPHPRAAPSIVWGDAKLANLIYEGSEVRAVLDWELCSAGPAEEDLAHLLWMDEFASGGQGIARLEGLPERAETLARYAEALGRPLEAIDWWSTFVVVRLQAIIHRIMHQVRAHGGLPPETELAAVNPVSRFVEAWLAQVR